jgi:flagellin-like hook-associated protein FlgL
MVARSNLGRNMSALETSLERLSTGFKINGGKDDPAGLIASEILRSDMTGIKTAIKNTERANMMIATADSALNEVTNLLNDIRGLVTEAANTGAMSAEMIAANQLQVDASLDAIDRIASQTTFMGLKLLDGTLDFDLTGVNRNDLQDLSVHQVTFGSDKTPVDVNVTVRQAAEKAALYFNNPALAEDIVLQWGGNYSYSTQSFQRGATVTEIARVVNASSDATGVIAEVGSDAIPGTILTSSLGLNNDIIITAGNAGLNGGNVEIKYLKGTSEGITVKYEEPIDKNSPAKLLVYLQTEEYKNAVADDVDNTVFVNGQSVHDNNALKFEANIPGAQYNDANIHFVDGRFTQANFGDPTVGNDPNNPYGVAGHQYAYYNDEPTVAKALFGDVNGLTNITNLDNGAYFTIQSKEAGSTYNNVAITFLDDTNNREVPAGKAVQARYVEEVDEVDGSISKTLKIYFKDGATIQQVQDALKLEGHFELTVSNSEVLTTTLTSADSFDSDAPFDPRTESPGGYGNTNNSGGEAGTLFIVLPSDGDDPSTGEPITANDIVAMFDPTHQASRGSERAADLFNVSRTVDNDGTGVIHLYEYTIAEYTDADGDPIPLTPKTEFNRVFQEGVTGGEVISTAAELVTALNNSAYWGMEMCPELIAELAGYNAQGTYYDATTPPVITAKLAPGNFGNQVVAAFEEVAYYGNPNEGNALQFLGEKNSPNIRFVAEPGNSELWIDRTTVPDKVDFAKAILTAKDSKASLIVTANEKGENSDDVQFVFKRISENPESPYAPDVLDDGLDPNRKNGWVEYDPGKSYAEAQATFKSTDGYDIANTAFYVTATERGDMFNNIPVLMTTSDTQAEAVKVIFDTKTSQLRVSLNSSMVNPPPAGSAQGDAAWYPQITANDVIAAINNANLGFTATLSYSQDTFMMYDLSKPITDPDDPQPYEYLVDSNDSRYPVAYNDGSGTFEYLGLKLNQFTEVANTKETGGHLGGTVTVWMTDQETIDDAGDVVERRQPNANDVTVLLNNDQVVGRMFNARTYSSDPESGNGYIDFVKDGPIVTSGGLVEKGAITVHLVTDDNGLVQTTAKNLATWWDVQDPKTVDNISVSIVRPAGAVWDECNDPYGDGLLAPTISRGDCDEWIINDIQFVGWNDNIEQQHLVLTKAKGTMTSDNGINASYDLIAKQNGPEYNGYTIVYSNDSTVTGLYADNYVEGSEDNPCDEPEYTGLDKDDCDNLITPQTTSSKGMRLELDSELKTITIHLRAGITTAYDIEQLIENDPQTRNIFEVLQHGDGTGVVSMQDDTLLTKDGALPAGELNGAKLLFGADASDYFLIFKSLEYGSDQFVDVQASTTDGKKTTFVLNDKNGNIAEKVYGKDVEALINGVQAVGRGLDVSLNTATLSLDMTLNETVGTNTQYATSFSITGGGATYQVGPDVVSNQQITLGIQSVNTVKLGGASGKMYQLRSGQNASLTNDTNKAFRIVEESILAITSTRGRLGTMQKATFETNINVLNDTLEAITEAESQIRDTDFAEETANLTRAQILVQSNISTLGIANQIPNYMLGLLQ